MILNLTSADVDQTSPAQAERHSPLKHANRRTVELYQSVEFASPSDLPTAAIRRIDKPFEAVSSTDQSRDHVKPTARTPIPAGRAVDNEKPRSAAFEGGALGARRRAHRERGVYRDLARPARASGLVSRTRSQNGSPSAAATRTSVRTVALTVPCSNR